MQLRVVFLVAFGPALTTCQNPTIDGPAQNDLGQEEDWSSGNVVGNGENDCPRTPNMPQTFMAERSFWTLFNTIVFYDRKGVEFGYVESWFGDWKNPFGYPGASFYLKVKPHSTEEEGIWSINPQANGNSQQGWDKNSRLTHEGVAADEESLLVAPTEPPVAVTGNVQAEAAAAGGPGQSFWDNFYRDFRSNKDHQLSAFMVGNHEPPVGKFWEDEMTIRDCKGQATAKAYNGNLIFREAKDAQYYQKRSDTANELFIQSLAVPPKDLVKLTMQEPCRPFPTPFTCAQMGMWNWFIHGYKWSGELLTPGSDSNIGNGLIEISMEGGKAEDMRFLTLYSAYQFSNTRWSPCMNFLWWILFLIGLGGCLRCCYNCCGRGDSSKTEVAREETQKLMETIETLPQNAAGKEEPAGFMACCSRRGGRGVGLS